VEGVMGALNPHSFPTKYSPVAIHIQSAPTSEIEKATPNEPNQRVTTSLTN